MHAARRFHHVLRRKRMVKLNQITEMDKPRMNFRKLSSSDKHPTQISKTISSPNNIPTLKPPNKFYLQGLNRKSNQAQRIYTQYYPREENAKTNVHLA